MIRLIPNFLTIMRILLTPVFIYLLFWGSSTGYFWALAIFLAAGITDMVDGHLARKWGVESAMGKLLDPLADKILVLSAFISFVELDLVFLWMVVVIVLRDVAVTGIRFLLEHRNMPMATSNRAKGKTAIQIFTIIFILAYLSLKATNFTAITGVIENWDVIMILMSLTVILTVFTGVEYFIDNRISLKTVFRPNTQ